MRISAQEQICEILASVYDGVKFVANAPEGTNTVHVVIEDCIDAISILRGALTAQLSDNRAVFYLQHLDHIAAEFDNVSDNAYEILDTLRFIYDELANEAEVKLEIAFFPYKASMWDALESIWLAARDDERCNVTVVPIRYIDRNPDGSVAAVHCERNIFPDYVPVTRFEDYNLENRAPDIAYIHNPYDGNNFVTSVDPAYYSHELKEYVDLLVYVPYYVSGWKSSEVFSMSAATTAADIIIAFSEEEAENLKSYAYRKEILPLGSPKVDRILRFEREKPVIPEQWREKFEGKKVFLLNTSVSSLLQHTDKFVDKMNRIFDIFKNRDDAALLWRPHPLSDATINSMRTGLREGYAELTRRIHEVGVFDETADVTRAIALSDGYIGESGTSLLFMYGLTGKPLYLVNFDIVKTLENTERDEILRSVCIMAPIAEPGGETALGVSYETNEICRIDLQSGDVTPLMDIPELSPDDMYAHVYIVDCGDKYILPPYCSDRFIELDRDFKLIKTVELPERAESDLVFSYSVRHGDYVYFLPSRSRAIARYSIKTGEYKYFYGWYKDFEKYAEPDDPAMFIGSYCIVGKKMYLPCYKDNIIAELNLDTMKLKAHRIGPDGYRYYSIAHDGKAFWLTQQRPPTISDSQWSGSIVRWDIKTGKVTEYNKFPEGFVPGGMGFSRIMQFGADLLVFPYLGNMVLRLDPRTGEMSEFGDELIKTVEDGFLPDPANAAVLHAGQFESGMLWAAMAKERALLTINMASGEAKKILLRFKNPHREDVRTENKWFMATKYDRTQHGIFIELPIFPAEEFIRRVVTGEIAHKPEQAAFYLGRVSCADGTSGRRIHEHVINRFIGATES